MVACHRQDRREDKTSGQSSANWRVTLLAKRLPQQFGEQTGDWTSPLVKIVSMVTLAGKATHDRDNNVGASRPIHRLS